MDPSIAKENVTLKTDITMYTTDIFEQAINSCGYILDRVIYQKDSREVHKIIGRVSIPKKVTIDGIRKTITTHKKFRWDYVGRCYSLRSPVRKRCFDLPIRTILEFNKQKAAESEM